MNRRVHAALLLLTAIGGICLFAWASIASATGPRSDAVRTVDKVQQS